MEDDNKTGVFLLRKLSENLRATVDLGVILMIGIAFAGMMVIAFLIFELRDQMLPEGAPTSTSSHAYNQSWDSAYNITSGFDDAWNLILVAITIFILAIAIGALLMLRGRRQ